MGVRRVQAHGWPQFNKNKNIYLVLKEAGKHLRIERDGLQIRHDKQLYRLRFFRQALKIAYNRLISVLKNWNYHSRANVAESLDNEGGR